VAIIIEKGRLHIETHVVPVTVSNAEDDYFSANIPLDRPGNVMAILGGNSSSLGNVDNAAAIGLQTVVDGGFGSIGFASFETNFRCAIHKLVGTSGDVIIQVWVTFIIRSTGS